MVALRGPPRFCLLVSASLVPLAIGARASNRRQEGQKVVTVDAAGSTFEGPQDTSPQDAAQPHKFTILASTFNAGNKLCATAPDFDSTLASMVEDHESADLVITGFQEYLDACTDETTTVTGRLQELLWKSDKPEKPEHEEVANTSTKKVTNTSTSQHVGPIKFSESKDSGWACKKASHYDTDLHAFVNPRSAYEVTILAQTSKSITDETFSCGKVLNFMQLQLELKDALPPVRTTVCVLNAHFSFAKKAEARAAAAKVGFELVQEHGCQSAFWVADFNTRLHCEPHPEEVTPDSDSCRQTPIMADCAYSKKEAKDSKKPKTEVSCHTKCDLDDSCVFAKWCNNNNKCTISKSQPESEAVEADCSNYLRNSGFKKLTDQFCEGECKLADDQRNYDELAQILTKDELACYEGEKSSDTGGYELKITDNTEVKAFGWTEAAPVNFPPSYKVKLEGKKASKSKVFEHSTGDKYYLASDGKSKHNFAWTDRVIMKSTTGPYGTTLETKAYNRKQPVAHPGSDHLPVSALVEVTFASGQATSR